MAYVDPHGKQKLEQLERLEGELQNIAIEEITHVVHVAARCAPDDTEGRKGLLQCKNHAASTVALMSSLARYAGLKKGTLSRGEFGSPGNYPQADVDRAAAIVERITARIK